MSSNGDLRKIDMTLCRQMALGCKILYVEGQNDINHGQISARIPHEDKLLIRGAAIGFDEVEEDDFARIDLTGKKLSGECVVPPEWPIHTEIYRAHPDVNCIVHTHAPNAIVFSSLGQNLAPISHDACPFHNRLPVFSATTNTITTVEMAEKMVASLNGCPAILLKNHGIVTTGRSVKEAVVRAIVLERACAMQLKVPAGWRIDGSPDSDVGEKNAFIFGDIAVTTYWQYFARKLQRIQENRQLSEQRLI